MKYALITKEQAEVYNIDLSTHRLHDNQVIINENEIKDNEEKNKIDFLEYPEFLKKLK